MPSFIVKQPDGRYAEFSTIVDDFTALDMTREEAVEVNAGLCPSAAEAKVARADREEECSCTRSCAEIGTVSHRWISCLAWLEALGKPTPSRIPEDRP